MIKQQTTKEKILNSAEKIFAEFGYANASMRAIMEAAKVNLSVAYHYFESKEALLIEVLERCLRPILEEEGRSLAEALKKSAGKPLSPRELLKIFTMIRLTKTPQEAISIISMLFSQVNREISGERAWEILQSISGTREELFEKEFSRSLPKLSLEELRLRIFFANTMLYGNTKHLQKAHRGTLKGVSEENYLESLLISLEAVLSAPPTF